MKQPDVQEKIWEWKCKHKWKIVVNQYDKSPMERLRQQGIYSSVEIKGQQIDQNIYFGTRTIILKCTKCGKLDKTITKV